MSNPKQDDRILVETRAVAAIIILVLLLAVLALYIFPQYTDQNFAWTITPLITPMLMGAGYLAGAYFFLRVLRETKWHRVQAGFLPITVFTMAMLGATLLHWDRFHQGTLIFFLWTGIYLVTPLLVPFLWWRNHSTDPGTLEGHDRALPVSARWALRLLGLVGAALMLIAFIQPTLVIAIAPWKLTPLTARVGAGWGMLSSLSILAVGADGRWGAARILVESAIIGLAFMLLALPRAIADFDWSKPNAWVFTAGLAGTLVLLVAARLSLDGPRKPARAFTDA